MVVEIKFPPVFDPIKAHIGRHKVAYSFGTGVAIAGITCVIMRGRYAGVLRVPDGSERITIRPFTFLSNRTNIITLIGRETQGPPSWVVRCKETGDIFISQLDAARTMNLSPSNLSSHLNGKYSDVSGFHFERICLAA